jgi:hypothetical protein
VVAGGRTVPLAAIKELESLSFAEQAAAVKDLGFSLFVKRASVNGKKNIRVRPRFEAWSISGTIEVSEPAITDQILRMMFEIAGKRCGFLDWRPSSKTPGHFGMFTSKLTQLKKTAVA